MLRLSARMGIFFVFFMAAALVVSFGMPFVFDQFEAVTGSPLTFEGALRISILAIHALLLSASLAWVLKKGTRTHAVLWSAFFVSFLTLGIIFFFDQSHRLLEEYSWIRYSTAAFLFLGSAAALVLILLHFRSRALFEGAWWALVCAALLFAGLDELFEIHEAIGRFLQATFSLGGATTDFVTIAYAFITVIVVSIVIFIQRSQFAAAVQRNRMSALLFFSGALVYAASTLLDTLDVFIHAKLSSLANVLSSDPRFVMSDAWYLLWSVKNSTNGFEEVLEHTAALLFFLGCAVVLFPRVFSQEKIVSPSCGRAVVSRGVAGCTAAGFLLLIFASLPQTFPQSVVKEKALRATPIANYFDGLFHADDLDFHLDQGVVLSNEGRGSIYRFQNDRVKKIPDPKKLIQDPDSLSATKEDIFVSDGNKGQIFRIDSKGAIDIVATRADGLVHPEGIVAAGDVLYILDESQKSISRFAGKKLDVWKPNHPDWKTPEGVAYDPKTKTLFVTDDTTGAIFKIDFKNKIEKIATLEAPEDIAALKDGSMLVTDTAWGAVFRIFPDGKMKEKIIQFRRMYRDTQGVTVDGEGRVYVVTADGFASTSFMPSLLFQIVGVAL